MQTVILPYELLARFDRTGSLSGIHVQYRTMILDGDGAVLSDTPSPACPLEEAPGFPLSDLLERLRPVGS